MRWRFCRGGVERETLERGGDENEGAEEMTRREPPDLNSCPISMTSGPDWD
jgi:hypothetical protein